MTHATGVSSGYSPTIGLGRDSEGDLVYGLAITRSQTNSKIANETAPPEDPTKKTSWAVPVLVFMVIFVFVAWLYVSETWYARNEIGDIDQTGRIIKIVLASGFTIFCFVTSIYVIISSSRSRKEDIKRYQRRIAHWRNSWICLSCGTRWRQK